MKYALLMKLLFLVIVLHSCSFEDSEMVYEEKLVVFASISADLPVIDTVLVSKTAGIEENVVASDLFINDAQVSLIEDSSGNTLDFFNVGPGNISQYQKDHLSKNLRIMQILLLHQDGHIN